MLLLLLLSIFLFNASNKLVLIHAKVGLDVDQVRGGGDVVSTLHYSVRSWITWAFYRFSRGSLFYEHHSLLADLSLLADSGIAVGLWLHRRKSNRIRGISGSWME